MNFTVLWLYAKVFSAKFGVWRPLARQKQAICESFLHENRIFTNSRKFSPLKIFRYTVSTQILTGYMQCVCVTVLTYSTNTLSHN